MKNLKILSWCLCWYNYLSSYLVNIVILRNLNVYAINIKPFCCFRFLFLILDFSSIALFEDTWIFWGSIIIYSAFKSTDITLYNFCIAGLDISEPMPNLWYSPDNQCLINSFKWGIEVLIHLTYFLTNYNYLGILCPYTLTTPWELLCVCHGCPLPLFLLWWLPIAILWGWRARTYYFSVPSPKTTWTFFLFLKDILFRCKVCDWQFFSFSSWKCRLLVSWPQVSFKLAVL